MKNTLKKYTSNPIVFCLESQEIYKKDDVVKYLTKYGKEIELIIYKLIFSKNDLNYYSYLRTDGKNRKTVLGNKIEKRKEWAEARENKSNQYFMASKEGADFLALAEPIKIGHHSESRHRALIERNWNRMGKCVENSDKAKEHLEKAKNLEAMLNSELPLDTPDCLDQIKTRLEKAEELHLFFKDNPEKRPHSFALSYAKKKVNDLTKKLDIAKNLWELTSTN